MTGFTAPEICPLLTARDCRTSNSIFRPAGPLLPTTIGVGKLTVMSTPATEGKGASSPVTNTLPGCDCPGLGVEELEAQPTSMKVTSRVVAVNAKNLFM